MSKLILDSKSRLSNSSLTEPTWKLPSNVPSGILTVEQFNWNDVGYDLVGPEDYSLRVYADQYGSLLYDDKGSVTGGSLNFNPDGDNTLVQGKAGGIIDFAGIDTATQGNSNFNRKGSYINTNYSPTLNNDAEFTWTLLFKADDNAVDQIEPTTGGNIFTTEPATGTTPTPFINISVIDVADGSNHNAFPAITISIRNAARTFKFGSSNINVFDTDWHRIVILSDNSELKIYVDGVLSELFNSSGSSIGFHLDSPGGTMENSNKVIINGKLQRYWHAETSDIRFYERALSTTEIATLGNTPYTSVAYSNFASPLLIHHNPSIRADFLATTKKNEFMYFQLFIGQTHAKAMNLVEVRLLDTNNANLIRDRDEFKTADSANKLAVGTNPSASHLNTGDALSEIIDNSIRTSIIVGDPSDGHDELIQFKLARSFSFDQLRRLEVYFFDNNGPHEIRFLNENYELIHTHHLYASTPNYGDTNESLVVLKMLGASPMSGLTDSVADDVETYVLSWADESSISSTFIYRKEDTVGIDRVITEQPFRNMTLAMMLPGGYEKGSYDSIYRNQLMSSKDSGNAGLSPQPGNITNSDDANPRGTILGFGYNYYVDLVNGHRVYSTYTGTGSLGGYDVGNAFNGTADQLTRWIPNINLGYPATFVYDFTQNVSLTGVHVTNGDAGTQLVGDVDIYYYNGAWVKVTNQSPAALTQGISVRGIITFDYAESQYFKVELYQRNTGSGDHIRVRNIEFFGHPASHTQGSYTPSHPLDGVEKQSDGQVGFKFEKADGSAITDSELPSSYSLMCHIGG